MTEARTLSGGCHCGAVRYEFTAGLSQIVSCNCSICLKRGLLLAFVPATDFKIVSGAGEQTDYQFGRKSIHHLFCPACGIESFAAGRTPDGAEMIAINVRCLDDVDIDSLETTPFDGKHL
jgi:hypothetical protein